MAKKDLFGRERDAERRAAIEREAAEEVERLTRRTTPSPGGILGGGGLGGGPGGGGPVAPPSDLEMIADSVRERPRGRGATGLGGRAPNPASAFPFGAAMLSGSVGSGLGPAGLSPGPGNRGSGSAVPAGHRSTPSPDYADVDPMGGHFGRAQDEDEEEMSITEMALTDYAARSGSSLEDVAVQVDVESAEEARDRAMRQFHERQQTVRRPMAAVTDPFAPAAVRSGSASAAAAAQARLNAPGGRQRPESAGSALAARIAARRRQDEQKRGTGVLSGTAARPAAASPPAAAPRPAASPTRPVAASEDAAQESGGALARLAARRRPEAAPAPGPEEPVDTMVNGIDGENDGTQDLGSANQEVEEPDSLGSRHTRLRQQTRAATPPAEPIEAPSPPAVADPNAHLYEALMEERAARLALEARLEALAAASAPPAARRRTATKKVAKPPAPKPKTATKKVARPPAAKPTTATKAARTVKAPAAKAKVAPKPVSKRATKPALKVRAPAAKAASARPAPRPKRK